MFAANQVGPATIGALVVAVTVVWLVGRPAGEPTAAYIGQWLGAEAILLLSIGLVLISAEDDNFGDHDDGLGPPPRQRNVDGAAQQRAHNEREQGALTDPDVAVGVGRHPHEKQAADQRDQQPQRHDQRGRRWMAVI